MVSIRGKKAVIESEHLWANAIIVIINLPWYEMDVVVALDMLVLELFALAFAI